MTIYTPGYRIRDLIGQSLVCETMQTMIKPEEDSRSDSVNRVRGQVRFGFKIDALAKNRKMPLRERPIVGTTRQLKQASTAKCPSVPACGISIAVSIGVSEVGNRHAICRLCICPAKTLGVLRVVSEIAERTSRPRGL